MTYEPEIFDGEKGFDDAQLAFAGTADPSRLIHAVACGWHHTSISQYEGAFCVVQTGSALEELVGDVVEVKHGTRTALVYCVGTSRALITPISLSRPAFIRIAQLYLSDVRVLAQAVTRG
jgi:hypothetical protein